MYINMYNSVYPSSDREENINFWLNVLKNVSELGTSFNSNTPRTGVRVCQLIIRLRRLRNGLSYYIIWYTPVWIIFYDNARWRLLIPDVQYNNEPVGPPPYGRKNIEIVYIIKKNTYARHFGYNLFIIIILYIIAHIIIIIIIFLNTRFRSLLHYRSVLVVNIINYIIYDQLHIDVFPLN